MTRFGRDRERASECRVRDASDQRMRRVERTAALAIPARHERFESFAEHLRIHGQLDQVSALFSRREPVTAEQLAEQSSQLLVGKNRLAEPAFVRRACEETAIEKWNTAELPGRERSPRVTS